MIEIITYIITGIITIMICAIIEYLICNRYKVKHNYLINHGFKYEIYDISEIDSTLYYHYIKNNQIVGDHEVKKLSYKKLKAKYK